MKEVEHPMKLLQNIGDTGGVVMGTTGVQTFQLLDFTLSRFLGIQMYSQYIFTHHHGHKQIYCHIRRYRINQIYRQVYVGVETMTVAVLVLVITTI